MNKIIATVVLVAITFTSASLFAQAPPPSGGTGAPIDGGAIALVLGAAALGYQKMRNKNK